MSVGLVIGNGGSLAEMPLDFLWRYPSIGSNHIFLLEGFTPTFYTAVDSRDLRNDFEDRLNQMHCFKLLGPRVFKRFNPKNVIRFDTCGHGFSKNPFETPMCEGWSVTYINLQLAYYLGWKTVLLVGVDHWSGGRADHFTPNYYDKKFDIPANNDDKLIAYFKLAKQVYENEGRRIINITPGSALHVFEKEDWQKWNI